MRPWEAILLAGALLTVFAPSATAGTTLFDWSTRQDLGDTVVQAQIDLPEDTDCRFEVRMGGSVHPHGGPNHFAYLVGPDGVVGSAVVSVMPGESAHVGEVDTRPGIRVLDQATLLPPGQWGSEIAFEGVMPAGELTFTVGGFDLHTTGDAPGDLGYHSLGLTVDCQAPFQAGGYAVSHELLLFNANSMQGGAGAFVSLVAGVSVEDSVERTFTSPEVHSRVSWREYQEGAQAGTLTRTTPVGTTTYDLGDPAQVRLEDTTGPGLHRYEMTRVGLDFFSTMTGVVYGLGPATSLDEVLPA